MTTVTIDQSAPAPRPQRLTPEQRKTLKAILIFAGNMAEFLVKGFLIVVWTATSLTVGVSIVSIASFGNLTMLAHPGGQAITSALTGVIASWALVLQTILFVLGQFHPRQDVG